MSCIALLGGSFDPVHNGHVALARHFGYLLRPDEIRVIPAGNPWQKAPLKACAEDRVEMARLAFGKLPVPVKIDAQEIKRYGPSYTIDTLRAIREETGPNASLVFLLGADQLHQLHTWHEWQELFDHANICAVSRPGFAMNVGRLPDEVREQFALRESSLEDIREASHGKTYLTAALSVDISSTAIRAALARGERPAALVPDEVLDYIQQHHLYRD